MGWRRVRPKGEQAKEIKGPRRGGGPSEPWRPVPGEMARRWRSPNGQ